MLPLPRYLILFDKAVEVVILIFNIKSKSKWRQLCGMF